MKLRYLAATIPFLLAGSASAQDITRGGTLTYSYNPEPAALSTIATTSVPVVIAATKIYESLLEFEGPSLDPKPGLAEKWEISDDKLTYTFHLRPGVKWHDGKPFTSQDVKFSIEKVVKPFHSRGQTYFGTLQAIDTPDDLTVIFRLGAPVPFFMKAFQPGESPMMPRHGFTEEEIAQNRIRQAGIMQKPIGTGPFRLAEWTKGSHVILERNADYWKQGKPYLDRIVMRAIPDGAARAIALETGEIDLVPMSGLPPAEMKRLAGLDHLTATLAGSEALGPLMWLEVNVREKPLADMRVRQAISFAIDRQRLVNVIWYGNGKPARGPLVSSNPRFFNTALEPLRYDPKEAEKLLDEAGFKRGKDGVRFELTQNALPYGEEWVRQAEYIRQELGKIGIKVNNEALDMGGWLKKIYTDWNFHFTSNFIHNHSDPSIGLPRSFTTSGIRKGASFTNSMGYSNPRIDELFVQAAKLPDGAERKKIWDEVQVILQKELPVIFLIEMGYNNVFNKRVNGLITNGISLYSNWDSVWIKK
ncbi:ABC transporter substrate-binding protein [Bosea sp. (in: a-proteobacteria)]|uniref:ABC transporter substrate-binding protein n=1 Tax=Bosea sp. (in: a-proteobacteria) TaxID=1871050 RepID=UPI00260B2187|nr:ABC transporter substrate-binding protein [Bosea sp. (in: a-proteobacteria)]MCO5093589.1 ABC transporter substrate-binding protein [Bosea sp. (in: a-proteobacteria)]